MRKRGPSNLEPLGALLGRESGIRAPSGVEVSPIAFRDWEAAVGTRIAARTRPIKLERGILLVLAASATWAQELTLLADAILEQLRSRRISVKALRFRVGHVDAPDRPPQRVDVRKAPAPVPLPADLRAELARVDDDALREAIARAAARNLGWQRLIAKPPAGRPRRAPPPEPEATPPRPPPESENVPRRARPSPPGTQRKAPQKR